MTTDTLGGVWTYCMELCRILQNYEVEVHLASMGGLPSASQEEEVSQLDNVKIYRSDYKLEWMQDCEQDLKKAREWILDLFQEIEPQLVHLNNYMPIDFEKTPVITVIHSCVETWWQSVKGKSAPAGWSEYRQLVKTSLEKSDRVIGPTSAILKQATETYGISTPTSVIHNGRDFKAANSKKEDFIFAMGRIWDEAKNLKLLSEIAGEISWPVYIAGNNQNPSDGKKIETNKVHFLGELNAKEIQEYLSRAAVFVSPSLYEPFGLGILEAAKSSCALVLSDIDTLQELWCGAAVFFDAKKKEQLKKQLQLLIKSEVFRDDLGSKASKRAESYSLERMGENYMKIYAQLLKIDTNQPKEISYSL